MNPSKLPESLTSDDYGMIVESILSFDGSVALHLHWSDALTNLLRDPAVFDAYVATFALVHGPTPEITKVRRPAPLPKGD